MADSRVSARCRPWRSCSRWYLANGYGTCLARSSSRRCADAGRRARGGWRAKNGVTPDADELAKTAAARAKTAGVPTLCGACSTPPACAAYESWAARRSASTRRRVVAEVAAGYSLEYDLATGERGDRGLGVERWLTRLTGAQAAIVVNNGAPRSC
jgi:hypothetical protein